MVFVARKNLFTEKTRLIISVGGVTFAVLLIIILISLYQGWKNIVTTFFESIEADIWIVQEGASDMFHSISIIPQVKKEEIEKVEGVKSAVPLLGRQMSFDLAGKKVHTFLFGYDPKTGLGGPHLVVEGEKIPDFGEIIVDQVFAKNNNLKIGEKLKIAGKEFTISGISKGGNFVVYQHSFINWQEAEEIFEMEGLTNFYLVKVKDISQLEEIKNRINQEISGINAFSNSQFLGNHQEIVDETFLPILFTLILIGFGVGVTVIALTIYTATIEKSREYGILKAIGFSNLSLYKIIFQQSLISGLLGFVVGTVLAYGINSLATKFVPEFVTLLRWQDVGLVFIIAIAMSSLAAYTPIRKIAKIEPVEVFKA